MEFLQLWRSCGRKRQDTLVLLDQVLPLTSYVSLSMSWLSWNFWNMFYIFNENIFKVWVFFTFFFLIFIYFWERERQCVSRRGAEREGDTESEAGSQLWAVSTEPDAGLELLSRSRMLNRLSQPGTPKRSILNAFYTLFHFNLLTVLCSKSYYCPPLWMKKLRHREAKALCPRLQS